MSLKKGYKTKFNLINSSEQLDSNNLRDNN